MNKMNKGKLTFTFLAMLCINVITSSSAFATIVPEYEWSATEWGSNGMVLFSLTLPDTYDLDGDSFSMFSLANDDQMQLIVPDNNKRYERVLISLDILGNYKASTPTTLPPAINLGSTTKFGFSFYRAAGGETFYNYDLEIVGQKYVLTSAETGMVITLENKNGKVTPVPLPASVILLGSSILGLLGIGNRKKK